MITADVSERGFANVVCEGRRLTCPVAEARSKTVNRSRATLTNVSMTHGIAHCDSAAPG